jgi:hypothetical protein
MAVLKSLTFTTMPTTGTNPTVDRRAKSSLASKNSRPFLPSFNSFVLGLSAARRA